VSVLIVPLRLLVLLRRRPLMRLMLLRLWLM